MTDWLVEYGFEQCKVDPGIYTIYDNGHMYVLCVYVDDCIVIGKKGDFFRKFKSDFTRKFKIEELGPAAWLLGCSIRRDRAKRTLQFGQRQYVTDILNDFDIAAAVSHLSRYMSHPTKRHWEQGKRVLRYLAGTIDYCLNYSGDISPSLVCWQDASFGDGEDRKSRTGFVTMMCGAATAWGSRLQPTVALSTVEAE